MDVECGEVHLFSLHHLVPSTTRTVEAAGVGTG